MVGSDSRSSTASHDDSSFANDELPDWFWNLLTKSRQPNVDDVDADSQRLASSAQSSRSVPDQLSAAHPRNANNNEEEAADRQLRLQELARLLATVDDTLRRNEYIGSDVSGRAQEARRESVRSRGSDDADAEDRLVSLGRSDEIDRTREEKVAAFRKELLSRWLASVS